MEEENENQTTAPKFILYFINKAEDYIHQKKFIKSFFFGIIGIIIGLMVALIFKFRKILFIGVFSVVLFYILVYILGI